MIKNIILDFGHGGIDENGNYTTLGKKHTFPNGETAYEGVINRRIGGMLRAFPRARHIGKLPHASSHAEICSALWRELLRGCERLRPA